MHNLCSIGELALVLGVAISTLRRWHASGSLAPACRTPGGHRRYAIDQVKQHLGLGQAGPERQTLCYARVSSHDQKEQLVTQAERLRQHCHRQGWTAVHVIPDLGSGMNYKKPGLLRLLKLVLQGQVGRLVLVTKDRLFPICYGLVLNCCYRSVRYSVSRSLSSTKHKPPPRSQLGAIGVDFNAVFLEAAKVDRFGNIVRVHQFKVPEPGLSAG